MVMRIDESHRSAELNEKRGEHWREKEHALLPFTCCFSGHRKIPAEDISKAKERLRVSIVSAIHEGYRYFGTGGALGFDTLAAQTILSLKKTYPQIRLILVLPCQKQTHGWKTVDVAVYECIYRSADKIVYTSKEYYEGCMLKRNRHLIEHSSLCICYLTNEHSGTGYTIRYAKQRALRVINLADESFFSGTE